jgi:hypothetical protein
VRGLEAAELEFDGHEAAQAAVEEQQVAGMEVCTQGV